ISVLDARTGAVVRTIPVPGSPYGVTVDRVTARLFVAENDHGVVVVRTLDAHTGASLHTVTVDGPVPLVAMDELTDRIFIPSPGSGTPSATPAGVYTHSGHVLILDARTGILLRTITVSRGP